MTNQPANEELTQADYDEARDDLTKHASELVNYLHNLRMHCPNIFHAFSEGVLDKNYDFLAKLPEANREKASEFLAVLARFGFMHLSLELLRKDGGFK